MIPKLGIDLGTVNTLVFLPGQGVVINEPSVVAIDKLTNKILAVGQEAKEMIGRTPGEIEVYRPLKDGVIADYKVTAAILRYFISKVKITRFFKPIVVISVPAGITSAEKRAIIDAAQESGAREVFPIKEPLLAALGAGIPVNSSSGNMIINIGGGTSEIAVISLGGIVTCNSIRVAGDRLDSAIREYLRKKFNLAVGEQTAEKIKINVGSAMVKENNQLITEVNGVNILTGLPKTIRVSSNDIAVAIQREINEIVSAIKEVLANTPPELVADIMEKGIILSGGTALLRDLDKIIQKITGVPTFVADEPLVCVARGTGMVLDKVEIYRRIILQAQK